MPLVYEEVELEDLLFSEEELAYSYPCPCGDKFRITLEELHDGEDIARCPSCSLRILVVFEPEDLPPLPTEEEDDDEETDELAAALVDAVTVSS